MRFIIPEIETKRIKKRFLFFPKRIKNEIRWLEIASWEEEVFEKFTESGSSSRTNKWCTIWKKTRWLN